MADNNDGLESRHGNGNHHRWQRQRPGNSGGRDVKQGTGAVVNNQCSNDTMAINDNRDEITKDNKWQCSTATVTRQLEYCNGNGDDSNCGGDKKQDLAAATNNCNFIRQEQ